MIARSGTKSQCTEIGTLVFQHLGKEIQQYHCLYSPLYSNLISGQRMGKHKLNVKTESVTLWKEGKRLYEMDIDQREECGHISYDTLRTFPGCPKFGTKPRCEKGKATKPPTKRQPHNNVIRTSRPLERLHAGLVGPLKPTTLGTQYKYLLVVTDDFSRYVITAPLRTKGETTKKLVNTISALEKAATHQVSQIQFLGG